MKTPRILVLDIETAPTMAYVWGLFKQFINTDMIVTDWYVLCWCAKWLGEDEVMTCALPDYDTYKDDKENDYAVMEELAGLLDMADIVITHNGDAFDLPRINTRMVYHGIEPYSPVRSIDTLKVAKKEFAFSSNKLDYISQFLGVGGKIKHDGFPLWEGCMSGDKASWRNMVDYCANDVQILEDVYLKMRAWHHGHPNLGVYMDDRYGELACPKCGSDWVVKDGTRVHATNLSKFQRYRCKNCGGYSRGRKNLADRKGLSPSV
jgi:DNA polymerase elongation subunit (family B)